MFENLGNMFLGKDLFQLKNFDLQDIEYLFYTKDLSVSVCVMIEPVCIFRAYTQTDLQSQHSCTDSFSQR